MATDTTDKPNIEETYTEAVATSNLKFDAREGSPTGAAGMLIAAGWSPTRLGAALMRLHSEWDSSSKPSKPTPAQIKALAATVKDEALIVDGKPVLVDGKPKMVPGFVQVGDRRVPRDFWAFEEAHRWYEQELRTLVGRLKTLTDARRELTLQAMKWKIHDPVPTAGAVIKYWLDQTCNACDGLKWKKTPGAPALSNRLCNACQGTGVGQVPAGQEGRRLANYMDDCVSIARRDISKRLRNTKKVA